MVSRSTNSAILRSLSLSLFRSLGRLLFFIFRIFSAIVETTFHLVIFILYRVRNGFVLRLDVGSFLVLRVESILDRRRNPEMREIVSCVLLVVMIIACASPIAGKSRRPVTDNEVRQKKNECYADIESGLWGWRCKVSVIAKENCMLKCLSPTCYELIYESDPLEEGEKDLVRGQEYKYCMHRASLGESLEGIKGSFDY